MAVQHTNASCCTRSSGWSHPIFCVLTFGLDAVIMVHQRQRNCLQLYTLKQRGLCFAACRCFQYQQLLLLDDALQLAPDALSFFAGVAWLPRSDPTLWCISAWNDNGVKNVAVDEQVLWRCKPVLSQASIHSNEDALQFSCTKVFCTSCTTCIESYCTKLPAWPVAYHRTDYHPGRAWMLSKEVGAQLLEQWPTTGEWHAHLLLERVRRGRQCIVPEIPRARDAGVQLQLNQEPVDWSNQVRAELSWSPTGSSGPWRHHPTLHCSHVCC